MLLSKDEPKITVGIMDRQREVDGRLRGAFYGDGFGPLSDGFSSKAVDGLVLLLDGSGREIARAPEIRLTAVKKSAFILSQVTIGNSFHWERREDQTFEGELILLPREDGTIAAVNEISLEEYLKSVISSEMSAGAPIEFLKAHAVLSRSWLLAALKRRTKMRGTSVPAETEPKEQGEVIRWYDREDHDLFDVCADDHCQRYQGITKITSSQAGEAVGETLGMAMTYEGDICDARYSKACGGITEDFATAWADTRVPYLASITDGAVQHPPLTAEEEVSRWILSQPEAYCNTKDRAILEKILPDFDQETKGFFRWRIEYSRGELEEILRDKSGLDFGTLEAIAPLQRGPSGRICRMKIVGSKRSIEVGKELEIRRWLSRSHLYSSAFIVEVNRDPYGKPDRFVFYGAGWGHGVGLCQIGAAVMATKGFKAEEILKHYFTGVEIERIY